MHDNYITLHYVTLRYFTLQYSIVHCITTLHVTLPGERCESLVVEYPAEPAVAVELVVLQSQALQPGELGDNLYIYYVCIYLSTYLYCMYIILYINA